MRWHVLFGRTCASVVMAGDAIAATRVAKRYALVDDGQADVIVLEPFMSPPPWACYRRLNVDESRALMQRLDEQFIDHQAGFPTHPKPQLWDYSLFESEDAR